MLEPVCSETRCQAVLPATQGVISPSAFIKSNTQPCSLWRQYLIFEAAPATNRARTGRGIVCVELADGRVFFLRISMAVLGDEELLDGLFKELNKLPEWIINWAGAAEMVGFMVGAPLEFIGDDPGKIGSWNIQGWRQHLASKLLGEGQAVSIRQISSLTEKAADELGALLMERVAVFMDALDRSVIGQCNQFPCSWNAAYNFLTPSDEKRRLYRRQATQVFPLLVRQLFIAPKEELTATVMKAIDAGIPLVDFMADIFDCSKRYIRHLNGLDINEVGTRWDGRLKELVMILGELDVNRLPKGRDEWAVFGETISLLSKMTKMPTTALSSRMLLGELSKQHWNRRMDISASFEERALAIERFAENVRQAIIATAWLNGLDVRHAAGNILHLAMKSSCSLGLSRLERLSRKWRAEELRFDAESCAKSGETFPVLLEEPIEVDGFKVVQLTTRTQLEHEGDRMLNCVGTYSGQCARGRAFIFSIRNKFDTPYVNVEYQLERSLAGLPELVLIQQKGRGNATPESKFQGAIQQLHRFTQSPHIRKTLLDLLVFQKAVKIGGADLAGKYARALRFIEFLDHEVPGRFDFNKMAELALFNHPASSGAMKQANP